jgi:hypothetical protein
MNAASRGNMTYDARASVCIKSVLTDVTIVTPSSRTMVLQHSLHAAKAIRAGMKPPRKTLGILFRKATSNFSGKRQAKAERLVFTLRVLGHCRWYDIEQSGEAASPRGGRA